MARNVAMLMVNQSYVQYQDTHDIRHKYAVPIIWMAHVHMAFDAHLSMMLLTVI